MKKLTEKHRRYAPTKGNQEKNENEEKKETKENARNYIYIAVHTLMCEELGCVSQVKLIPEIPL